MRYTLKDQELEIVKEIIDKIASNAGIDLIKEADISLSDKEGIIKIKTAAGIPGKTMGGAATIMTDANGAPEIKGNQVHVTTATGVDSWVDSDKVWKQDGTSLTQPIGQNTVLQQQPQQVEPSTPASRAFTDTLQSAGNAFTQNFNAPAQGTREQPAEGRQQAAPAAKPQNELVKDDKGNSFYLEHNPDGSRIENGTNILVWNNQTNKKEWIPNINLSAQSIGTPLGAGQQQSTTVDPSVFQIYNTPEQQAFLQQNVNTLVTGKTPQEQQAIAAKLIDSMKAQQGTNNMTQPQTESQGIVQTGAGNIPAPVQAKEEMQAFYQRLAEEREKEAWLATLITWGPMIVSLIQILYSMFASNKSASCKEAGLVDFVSQKLGIPINTDIITTIIKGVDSITNAIDTPQAKQKMEFIQNKLKEKGYDLPITEGYDFLNAASTKLRELVDNLESKDTKESADQSTEVPLEQPQEIKGAEIVQLNSDTFLIKKGTAFYNQIEEELKKEADKKEIIDIEKIEIIIDPTRIQACFIGRDKVAEDMIGSVVQMGNENPGKLGLANIAGNIAMKVMGGGKIEFMGDVVGPYLAASWGGVGGAAGYSLARYLKLDTFGTIAMTAGGFLLNGLLSPEKKSPEEEQKLTNKIKESDPNFFQTVVNYIKTQQQSGKNLTFATALKEMKDAAAAAA